MPQTTLFIFSATWIQSDTTTTQSLPCLKYHFSTKRKNPAHRQSQGCLEGHVLFLLVGTECTRAIE